MMASSGWAVEFVAPLIERPSAFQLLEEAAVEFKIPCYFWDFGSCRFQDIARSDNFVAPDCCNIFDVLRYLCRTDAPGIFVIENMQELMQIRSLSDFDSEERQLQLSAIVANLYFKFATSGGSNFLVLLSTNGLRVDDYLKGLVPSVFLPLPDREHLVELASRFSAQFGLNRAESSQLIGAMSGLFVKEIERGITLWQQGSCGENSDISSSLRQYKIGKFRELGLTFKEPPTLGEFGGLDLLRDALEDVKFQFSPMARSLNIPLPKGWLLVGPPGTGKTFAASVCSAKLGVPLVSVDVGALIAGGAAYLSCILQRVEAIGASVLYFDELDKLFSSNSSSLSGESGNSIQILGQLLSWLQDKTGHTFVIATLNRLAALPPELTRSGRFDAIFYVGFPQACERKQIVELHAARFDRRYETGEQSPLSDRDWQILLNATNNFVGAELARMVEAAAQKKAREIANILSGKNSDFSLWNKKDVRQVQELKCLVNLPESDLLALPLSVASQTLRGTVKLELNDFLEERKKITPLFVRDTDRILAMENSSRYVSVPASSPDTSLFAPVFSNFWGEEVSSER
jgi:hypothetical protein